jgi:hypothetical protein
MRREQAGRNSQGERGSGARNAALPLERKEVATVLISLGVLFSNARGF